MTRQLITTLAKAESLDTNGNILTIEAARSMAKQLQEIYPGCVSYVEATKEVVYQGPVDKLRVSCLECEAELNFLDDSPPAWMCPGCGAIHSLMKGVFSIIPTEGKLADWPEMQDMFYE